MATRYEVRLDKPPTINDFKDGFFPRRFVYRADAEELVTEVLAKGGEAHVHKLLPKE